MKHQLVTLEKQVYGGDCIAHLDDNRAVFVPFGVPGEQVELELIEQKERYARGRIVNILLASPHRVSAPCPHFMICGGCHYQHLTYSQQLTVKTEVVCDQLQRIGKFTNLPLTEITPCPQPLNYRNQVQFHPNEIGQLCFLEADGRSLLPIRTCLLPVKGISNLWPQINLEPETGLTRIAFREDSFENPFIIFEAAKAPNFEIDFELPVSAAYVSPSGVAVSISGEDSMLFETSGKRLKVSPESFFQVNSRVAESMIDHVLSLLPAHQLNHILELYCGVGLFSVFLAEHTKKLTAIESSPSACYDFADNLDAFDNTTLYEGSVETILPNLVKELKAIDLVLLDPPRAGLHPKALDALVKVNPDQIIYISCDPATLSRDLHRLSAAGYSLRDLHLFDMFPQTYHVEAVILMSRVDSAI